MKLRVLGLISLLALSPAAAYANLITYTAILNGPSESPVNASPGTGAATVYIDDVLQLMEIHVTFQGLTTGNTASHIHCCTTVPFVGTAGVATITPTFTGFPSGVTAGSYVHLFNLDDPSTYNPAFITASGGLAPAKAALLAGLALDETYLNIHTTMFPGGEIRGFLVQTPNAIPEPATLSLLALGLVTGGVKTWRGRRRAASN